MTKRSLILQPSVRSRNLYQTIRMGLERSNIWMELPSLSGAFQAMSQFRWGFIPYSRTGTFQPVAFFAMAKLLEKLYSKDQLIAFTKVRALFEEYLITHRDGMSIIIHRLGSGSRSLTWMQSYFERILERLKQGATIEQIREGFASEKEWAFITRSRGPSVHDGSNGGGAFNRNTKSAANVANIVNAPRCALCHGYIHRNSQQVDHKRDKQQKGAADLQNAQVTHPYCNSIKQHLE